MDMPTELPNPAIRSQVGGYLQGHESAVDDDRKVRLGLLFYILNDAILAIFFIGSYIFLRGYDTNLRFSPPGTPPPPNGAGFGVMIVAIAAAVAFVLGDRALNLGSQALFRLLTLIALGLAVLDCAGQVWLLGHLPFTVQSGSFATSYIVLSGYHVYHMALAVFVGLAIVVRAFKGLYDPAQARRAVASVPNESTGLRRNAETAALVRGDEAAAGVAHLKNTTGPRVVTYYYVWTATYAVAFWLLIIIQPPYHP